MTLFPRSLLWRTVLLLAVLMVAGHFASLEIFRARLSVLDRGPGIPAADAERMLQPFTRLNEARSTPGSGLGLAIVDRIAKMHGGTVQLLPRAGGGLEARVEFALPPAGGADRAP